MTADSSCLFCQIVAQEIPASFVFMADDVIAFHDIAPVAPIHVLIVPKAHVASVNYVDKTKVTLAGTMMMVAQQIALDLGVAKSGYRLVINTEKAAGQSVDHLHMHLLAGRSLSWPPG
jgi:histidine triad (HIT) family protein